MPDKEFKVSVDAELNTFEAEKKLNSLLKEKHKVTIDVDVSGQDTAKKLKQNIESGLKNVKIDTSAMSKTLADSFNITDKSTINRLQSQLKSMMNQLGKSWNGQKFDIGNSGFETSMSNVVNTIKKNAKTLRSSGVYDDFYKYFKNQKILITDGLKSQLGEVNYKELLGNNIGKLVTDAKKSTATINSMWGELNLKFPNLFPENITNQVDQLNHVLSIYKKAQAEMKQVSSSELNVFETNNLTNKAWESVVGIGVKMEKALKESIGQATEIGKTTIDLDVNVNTDNISSQIRDAIKNGSTSTGDALDLKLDINDEQLVSNLHSAIQTLTVGNEPVKVDIDVNRAELQEKLNNACHDMEIPVDFKIDFDEIASKIKSAVEKITDIELDLNVNADSIRKAVDESINRIDPDIDSSDLNQLQNALQGVNNTTSQSQNIFSSFGGAIKEAFRSVYSFSNFLQDGMYKVVEVGKKATETVKEFNDVKTNLAMATNADSNSINRLMGDYNNLAQELGSLTSSVAESADSWLRQGRSMADTNSLIKDSLVLSKDAELSSSDASEILTATLNGFQLAADQASRVNDILTSIDLESASGADSIGKGLMKVASQANNAGVSLEKTSAIIATIKDVTQDSDESIGTAMKSILSRMNQIRAGKFVDAETGESLNDTEKVLKKICVSMRDNTGMFRDSEGVLDDIAKKWKTLDSNSQKAVATATAGTYQYNKFIAAMDNWDKVEKLTDVAYNSEGTAEKKFKDNYLKSLEAKTNALKSSLEGLSTSLISDDMYSGFLDGSKAIVDFVDKTNLLKGALAGLGTFGGAFVFKNITSFISDAVKEMSNLGNALDIVKSGNISTKGFQELLGLTKGLSESEMQLVISSTALSNAQKVQLLTNSGVAQAEAESTVATLSLAAANGTATASTVSLGSAMEGLFSVLLANPIILLTTAVTAGVMAWQSYKQSVEDAVNSATSSGQKFSENYSSMNEQMSKVEELRTALDSGMLTEEEAYNTKSQLLDIQNQLSSAYGDSANSIDLVNGKMEEQLGIMQQLQVEDAKKTLNVNKAGFDKIKSEMTKNRTAGIAQFSGGTEDAEAIVKIAKKYKDKGLSVKGDSTGSYTIAFKGDVTQAESTLNDFMNEIQNRIDTVGDKNGLLNETLNSTSSELSNFKEIIDEYGDAYNNFLKADMISKGLGDGKPAAILEDYKDAIEKYNEALSNGDSSAIDKAKASFDSVSFSVDKVLDKYPQYKNLFDEVGDSLNESAVKTKDFKDALAGDDFKDIVSQFKNLKDVDLKGISFDDKSVADGEKALKSVVDKAIELGIVSDDSVDSISKVVDILVELGLTGSVSMSKVTTSFNDAQQSIKEATENFSKLKDIMAESVSGSGISADNVEAFKQMFGSDAEKALEKTANGYNINQKALAQLQEQQKQSTKSDYLSAIAEQQEALREVDEKIARAMFSQQDISGLQSQRQGIQDNISSLQDLQYQYETTLSAFNKWQSALSGGELGDMYDSIQGGIENAKDLYDKGLIGTNAFKEYTDLISDQDLSTANVDQIVAAYEAAMPKIERYFTEGQEGAVHFLEDIQNINSEWAHMNEDGSWKINFGAGNDKQIADALGIDVEAVQSVMRKLKDYGFDINLDQPVASMEQLKNSAQSAKEALDGMNDNKLAGINLDSSSFSDVTNQIDKVKDYIQTIEDSDVEPKIKTEKLQNANAILEYLVKRQQELGNSDIDIDLNIDQLEAKIEQAKSSLEEFKNSDGTIDLSIEGAQQAVDNLETLIVQKETLTNSSAVISVDASQIDGNIGNAIAKIQEYQEAVNNLNVQTELQKAGVQIDTSDAQAKVQQLAGEIQGLDGNTKASLSLDTSEVQSALTTLTDTKVDVKAGVNLDTSALGTIQSAITGITPEILVKAGVDKSQVDGYNPDNKDAKVRFKAEHSNVDAYTPQDKYAKVNYTVSVLGLENIPGNKTRTITYNVKTNGSVSPANGTAHSIGTAHAAGTTNVSTSRNWGLKQNEPHALINELKPEIIVRDGQPFIVNGGDPAFTSLKQGDIVFNGEQSEALLKNGYVTGSHGKLAYETSHSLGTAFSNGTGKFNIGGSGAKATSPNTSNKSSQNTPSASNNSTKEATEEVIDWIETLLKEMSRLTELAVDNIDRAIGLVSKQNKAYEAIEKVQDELKTNQDAAQMYLEKANSISLDPSYKKKVRSGELSIETIASEDLKKQITEYKEYYEKYKDTEDKTLDLQDKLTDLAEKRLSIIEDEYDALTEINDAIKDVADSKMELNNALGVAIDNGANFDAIKESIKVQEDTYTQLTKKLNAYQAEISSQLSSGLLKEGSESYRNAMKNVQDFTANIYKASKELIELQDKLTQIRIDSIQYIIDGFSRRSDKVDKYTALLEASDKTVPENIYQERLDNNNAIIKKNQEARAIWLKRQATEDVGSENYQKYAEEIQKLDESTLDLIKDNESLKDSIYSLRIKNLEDAIKGYADLEDELSAFRGLLNDDAFLDKQGGITDEGLAQITLLSQSLGTAKQKIADYTTGLQKLKELYENNVISLDEYNEKSKEYREGIQASTKDVKSYQDSLTDLYMKAMQTEVDYLDKIAKKHKEALDKKRSYYEYDKKIKSQSKDINSLKAQYEAIKNSNNLADKARAKQLAAQIKEKEDELAETKRDHEYDMRSQGYDAMSDDLKQLIEDTTYDLNHSADKRLEVINTMLDKEVGLYTQAFNKINSVISNTGWVGSTDFKNTQSQMSTQSGASTTKNNATQSQSSSNQNPSTSASGTITSGIKDNSIENNRITEDIMKPENLTNRLCAELKVDKSSVTLEEGKSVKVNATIRPNDAKNKTLSFGTSNSSIATASDGTISAKAPGSCQIVVATTDGSGLTQTISVTVTKKPEPPKPQPKPSNTGGGDGVPRVGDVVTYTGSYFYDSWGVTPLGNMYSGVPNGVVIDGYSSSEFGGSATRTGDFKVHIKSADGRYGDLGWVRLNQISGYSTGTKGIDKSFELAKIDEQGKELRIKRGGDIYDMFQYGDAVVPKQLTDNLFTLAEHKNDLLSSVVSRNTNVGDAKIENNYGSLLTVNGNVDKETLPELKEIIKQSYDYAKKELAKELRSDGFRIRR